MQVASAVPGITQQPNLHDQCYFVKSMHVLAQPGANYIFHPNTTD